MKGIRRVVAWITVICIAVLIIGMVICAVTGSKYFWGMLFLTIAVPIVLWAFMWFAHLIYGDSEVIRDMEKTDKVNQD